MATMYLIRADCIHCVQKRPMGITLCVLRKGAEFATITGYCFGCGVVHVFKVKRDTYLKGDHAVKKELSKWTD